MSVFLCLALSLLFLSHLIHLINSNGLASENDLRVGSALLEASSQDGIVFGASDWCFRSVVRVENCAIILRNGLFFLSFALENTFTNHQMSLIVSSMNIINTLAQLLNESLSGFGINVNDSVHFAVRHFDNSVCKVLECDIVRDHNHRNLLAYI